MKTENNELLQSLLQTENEHWNQFAYRLHCKAIERGLFADTAQLLQLVDNGTDILSQNIENPTKAVEMVLKEIENGELTSAQQLFVYDWIDKYLDITEFDGKQLTLSQSLLKSHAKRLRKEIEPVKPLVKNIREILKAEIQKEVEALPTTLKELEPEKRLNIICKLIPYVLPRVESVDSEKGEPGYWE